MPRKSKSHKTNLFLLKVFAIGISLFVLFRGISYVRQQHDREMELQKQESLQSRENFIKVIAPIAQREDKQYNLFPSVTIAQACIESNFGQSALSRDYNNLFGVKGTDPNTSKVLTTKEYVNGRWQTVSGRFQIYNSYEASIHAHTMLFVNGTTWNRNQYQHVLAANDYESQAKALQQDGYATDPGYADKLLEVIRQYDLTKYDN